jgi:hypothetical protein
VRLGGDRLRTVCFSNPTVLSEEVQHRGIGRGTAIGDTAPTRIRQPSPYQTPAEFVEQSRLANAGFTRNPHHMPVAILHLGQQRMRHDHLPVATNEPTQGTYATLCESRAARTRVHDPVCHDAFGWSGLHWPIAHLQLVPSVDQTSHLVGYEDLPRRCLP